MAPPQSASAVQPRHVPVAVAHTGVDPVHCALFADEHTPHAPLAWQAGVLPLQSVSAAQPWQIPAVVLQTGVVPLHWALLTQATQVPLPLLHTGVAPVHFEAFVAEHASHEPFG